MSLFSNYLIVDVVFLCSELLPDTGRYSSKQTSPRHNAYPTWAKEFIYAGELQSDENIIPRNVPLRLLKCTTEITEMYH